MRTRFAPSPTGYLHIGGVRTALFNWLLARRHGGQFILRIDDTDAERNRPEALQPILEGFRWLGIEWDEGPEVGGGAGPYFQSQRQDLYAAAARKLIAAGHAYPCYRSKDELDAERKEAERVKRQYVHRGQLRHAAPDENSRLFQEKPAPVRLKIPEGQLIVIDDLIRGRVEWQSDLIGDPVILRGDGRALYNFATVVDDAAMEITHVIRAAEHLSNTAIQVVVYQALGAALPLFAHVPVVNEPNSKKKLSKRDMKKFVTAEVKQKLNAVGWSDDQIQSRDDLNPATVAYYRELGYLPAGLVNYLGRLGWSLDDKSEYIPLAEMTSQFSLERVNNAPASFDPEKLAWLNGEYMKRLPMPDKVEGVIPFLRKAGLIGDVVDETLRHKIQRVLEACADRIKIFSDILLYGPFFFRDPDHDRTLVAKRIHKEGMPETIRAYVKELSTAPSFAAADLEKFTRAFCEVRGVKLGDLNHALRVGTTGVMVGPGMFDILSVLGRDETLRRLETALRLPHV